MSSGPKTRGSYGPTSPRGQAATQKQAAAIQAVKDQDMAKKMREAYENFQKSPEADTIGMKHGGKIKKMAEGGMTDEEKYGKVGAAIRRLDPEAYKNRKDKSAEANLRLLKELREKSSPRKMDTKEFIKKYEESDTPAGRVTKTETKTTDESPAMRRIRMAEEMAKSKGPGGRYTPAQGMSMAERRMRDDSEESPAMARIRMAREMAGSKGPGSRYTPAQGMSMAERRMREAGRMNMGGSVKKYAKGGSVSSASRRADGIAKKGKTKGRMV
jgi:hypothetical protein